jgi:hypothetical protein
MKPEQRVQQALEALAEHDRSLKSSRPAPRLPLRLKPVAKWKIASGYGAVLAAAAALVLYLLPQPKPQIVQPVPPPVISMAEPIVPTPPPAPKPVRRAKRVPVPAAEPTEVVTDFYPLMDAPPPFERGRLLRVVVPAATMHSVGLPVNPQRWSERVQADVLVGEEGMARAIRFVSYEQ